MSGKPSAANAAPSAIDDLYERDFYTWTQTQGAMLRAGRLAEVDLVNIAEEIETLGRSEASALRSAYRLILLHLLKMQFQPSRTSRSWRATIVRERGRTETIVAENPGLAPRRPELLAQAYKAARREAAVETGLDPRTFPATSSFTLDDVENQAFWPQA